MPRWRRRRICQRVGGVQSEPAAIVTGAWDESAGDNEPGGALANLALVRAYQCAFVASNWRRRDTPSPRRTTRHAQAYRSSRSWRTTRKYLVLDGSPLVVDFGFDDVPQVLPPGVACTIFGLLLLPIL